ncbi:hypothetical protein [Enteractinococcus helveticum]|uniref:Uncharacterized protein n=1 Tax=Enteractinococcus helveticum TaxID=1837282 RepID=A0A1B7LUW0_9MICC|nr:hypothetical protein [Enteractinococcus helveticum]OAV51218.1 hypothetical protein A6F49_02225 [Enteractinococcus helveticum]
MKRKASKQIDDASDTQDEYLRRLHEEINVARQESIARSRNLENRASFIAVACSIVIAAGIQALGGTKNLLIVLAVCSSSLGLLASLIAMTPKNPLTLNIGKLYDEFANFSDSPLAVEPVAMDIKLISMKRAEISERNKSNKNLAALLLWGFSFMAVATILLMSGLIFGVAV